MKPDFDILLVIGTGRWRSLGQAEYGGLQTFNIVDRKHPKLFTAHANRHSLQFRQLGSY